MDDFFDFWLPVLGIFAIVMAATFGSAFLLSRASCDATSRQMHVHAKWSVLTDCMIEYEPDKWVPLDNYRAAHVKAEGK